MLYYFIDLHAVKQEISALEAENAESENLRVTAEMKVVDLEEQLESLHKLQGASVESSPLTESERKELMNKIEHLVQENTALIQKVTKLEEKSSSETGSTDSFETIHEDRNELTRKIEGLMSKNQELEEKLARFEEGARSNVDSTESFETINDTDKSELIKKIDLLSRENSDLLAKLSKLEEKGSSETGSTESFEKIPEHGESQSRIEVLTRENNELVIKLTKLEEKYEDLVNPQSEVVQETTSDEDRAQLDRLIQENNDLVIELTKVREKLSEVSNTKNIIEKCIVDLPVQNTTNDSQELKDRIDSLTTENNNLIIKLVKLEEKNSQLIETLMNHTKTESENQKLEEQETAALKTETVTVSSLESEIEDCRKLISEQNETIEDMQISLTAKEAELEATMQQISQYEAAGLSVEKLQQELQESFRVIEEWKFKATEMERNMELLEAGKRSIEEKLSILHEETKVVVTELKQMVEEKEEVANSLKKELDETITKFETRLQEEQALIVKQQEEITNLREIVKNKDDELHRKYAMLQTEMINIDKLQDELESLKTEALRNETVIASLNEEIQSLQMDVSSSKEETIAAQAEIIVLREELKSKAVKEAENAELKTLLNDKNKLAEEMKTELNELLKENSYLQSTIVNLNTEIENLRELLISKDNEIASLTEVRSALERDLRELEVVRADIDDRYATLQNNFDENVKYTEGLRIELTEAYKMLELLKTKHTNDIDMQNRRLEDLFEDLTGKTSECEILREELDERTRLIENLESQTSELEILRGKLSEKEKLVGQNVTEEIKIALELKVMELEKKLQESEVNTQTQLQKRKILAANLKKKSSESSELEAKLSELVSRAAELEAKITELETKAAQAAEFEEKWIIEKSEKESANFRIQEMQSIVEVKDNSIIQLEEQLQRAQTESADATERMDVLSGELNNSTGQITALVDQLTEMREKIEKLQIEIDLCSSELEAERYSKERLFEEYQSSRKVLEEEKEKARELGVRMQVMETEYIDQLNTIQMLRTENGMLLSKQAQINERLDNSEKEVAEQKIRLDQLQRETDMREPENLQQQEVPDEEHTDCKASTSQPCDRCDQCQTVVQALEAKLQERDAEIENLDNELANSIGNFVHMRESLRVSDLMNQPSSRNRSLEDSRETNDLALQYGELTASNAEIRDQLNATLQENKDLKEKIASLQALNSALQERTGAVEEELIEGREATMRLQAVDALHAELVERCQQKEKELQVRKTELEVMTQRHDEWMAGMRSQIEHLEFENRELTKNCQGLTQTRETFEAEIDSLSQEVQHCQQRISELESELDEEKKEKANKLPQESLKRSEPVTASASSFFDQNNDSPQLFDAAKLFAPPAALDSDAQRELVNLRNVVAQKDIEINRLSGQIASSQLDTALSNPERLQNELTRLEELLADRDQQIRALNSEFNNVGAHVASQFNQSVRNDITESMRAEIADLNVRINDQERMIETLTATNAELTSQLYRLQEDNLQYDKVMCFIVSEINSWVDIEADKITEHALEINSPAVEPRFVEILKLLGALRDEKNELSACKLRITSLEKDLENSGDATRIQELEEHVDRLVRERDIKQLQVNDLTRSLEEMQESMERASSNEEIRLRNLQAALDQAVSEHERLKLQLETLKQETVKKSIEVTETQDAHAVQCSVSNAIDAESGWDDEPKLEADEEIWSWNPEDAQLADSGAAAPSLLPNLEITLKTKIAELEDTIKDFEAEKLKLAEEAKAAQIRSAKLVKKLKEFKVQNENLQQQLKIQKASGGICDLDSAIEEELKLQIATLEKSLSEAKEDQKKIIAERDNLAKRIDVLTSANERLVEMKERQDMDVEVLQIRTKDLSNKLQAFEWQFTEACGDEVAAQVDVRQEESLQSSAAPRPLEGAMTPAAADCLCKKYKEELDELRDEMEALAAENEQLRKILEEQKATRLATELKLSTGLAERSKEIEYLSQRNAEIQKEFEDSRNRHQLLVHQFDQSAKSVEEKNVAVKQTHDMLKEEMAEKTALLEAQIETMRREIVSAKSHTDTLQNSMQSLLEEKEELMVKTKSYEENREQLKMLTGALEEVTDLLNARVQEVAELKQEMQKLRADRNKALVSVEDLAQHHLQDLKEKHQQLQEYVQQCEAQLMEKNKCILEIQEKLTEAETERATNAVHIHNFREEIERLNNALIESRTHRESLQSELASKEQELFKDEDEVCKYRLEIERLNEVVSHMQKSSTESIDEANRKICEIEERERSLKKTIADLTARESEALAQMYREINEKDSQVASLQQSISNLEQKVYDVASSCTKEKAVQTPDTAESSSVLKILSDDSRELQNSVEKLRAELSRKNEEIEDYKYQLSESTYPSIIQALQDQVNVLYQEKANLESLLQKSVEDYNQLQAQSEIQNRHGLEEDTSQGKLDDLCNEKDTEIYNLRIEIDAIGSRYRDLHNNYETVEAEVNELRLALRSKDEEIRKLQAELESSRKECIFLQRTVQSEFASTSGLQEALQRSEPSTTSTDSATKERSANELDLALYMLHQRDVRCEELTHELMQLLEERDTLQLRLSNAIRVNEELRRSLPADVQATAQLQSIGDVDPVVEHPSPSRSVGPVEIAKEAIDTTVQEKVVLAEKYVSIFFKYCELTKVPKNCCEVATSRFVAESEIPLMG